MAAPEKPDLAAQDWLEIRVIDDEQRPIVDAEVALIGMRSETNRGTWYRYRGEGSKARTDSEGRVRMQHWVWVDQDGRTTALDVTVTHPDFPSFRDDSFKIGPGEHVIALKRGTMVVVSGRIAQRNTLVRDIRVQLDVEARLPDEAWIREPGGRLSTSRLLPGKHWIWLEHESAENGLCYSEITEFDLKVAEPLDLDLDLFPAETLEGQLDPLVPRPVEDGHVLLNLQRGGLELKIPCIVRSFEATVRDDGTFTLVRLPRGRGQVIALCKGWVSKRTLADSALEAGIHFSSHPTPEQEAGALREQGDFAF